MESQYNPFKNFRLTVAIPIVSFWTVLFLLGYPLPSGDDLFFTGAAINLAKGGEFTNPYLESWNSVFSSGKFYVQPPFHSYTLATWLKLTGISTASLRLFQYLCYNVFSLSCALLLRNYGFPKITAFCTTIIFAIWHCNPNPYASTGFRQDVLGMAYLALGLWLLTKDNWRRYSLGFSLIGSAVLTSPITAAYAVSFGVAIPVINLIYRGGLKNINTSYIRTRALALLAAIGLVFFLFLLCINFELKSFLSEFFFHASLRRTPINIAIPYFLMLITRAYGKILIFPIYILFLSLAVVVFVKRKLFPIQLKILFVALTTGIILNILLYSAATGFTFFFCWLGIVAIITMLNKQHKTQLTALCAAILILLSSQSLNILSLVEREYVPASQYEEIKATVLANPNRKYAVDEVAARFVFDYKLPKNTVAWGFLKSPVLNLPTSAEDKAPDDTWIVATSTLGYYTPEILKGDYPRVEFLSRRFNSLPKKPFDITVVP